MDKSRENAVSAVTRTAEMVIATDELRHRNDTAAREKAERAELELAAIKRSLTDAENAAPGTDLSLDGRRVGQIQVLLAEGGDEAVAKRFGDAALASPEAAKAKTQRAAIRRHERDLAERVVSDTVAEDGKQAARGSRTPLRDKAIECQIRKERAPEPRSR